MQADYNVIDKFLNAYLSAINSGFGLLRPDVMNVFGILIVIVIGITAVFWALDENNAVIAGLFRKTMQIGFFAWLLSDWNGLTGTIVKGFVALGLKAGGSSASVQSFLSSPGDLIRLGMNLVNGMAIQIKELTGPVAFFENFAMILILAVAIIGVIIAFVILAVQVFVTIIEFRLVTLAAFILVPFGIVKQTSFLSERALGYVASSGLKLLSIAVIVSVGSKTFQTLTLAPVPSVENAISILLASVVLVMLSLTVPSIAAALVTGGPQLGAGAALAGTAGVAAGVGGAYLAGRAAIGAPGAVASAAKAAAGRFTGSGSGGGGGGGGGGNANGGGGGTGGAGMQPATPQGGSSGGGGIGGGGMSAAASPSAGASGSRGGGSSGNLTGDGSAARQALANRAPGTAASAAQGGTSPGGSASGSTAANDTGGAAEASAPSSPSAPSTAPAPDETVRRASERRRQRTTRHAQAAMAATSAQGGAGMTASINTEDEA